MAKDKRYMDEELRKKGAERVEKGKSFEEKTGEVFKLMGFEVELNKERETAGNEIDIFLKKKKSLGNKYEYYVCECKDWKDKVGKDIVNLFNGAREGVKKKLEKDNLARDCDAIMVAPKGFTEPAREAASTFGIILYTYDELLSELMDFDRYLTGLIHHFESDPLAKLYIEQNFFIEPNLEEINGFQFVDRWLKIPGRKQVALLGDYGTGKTSFVRTLAYNMAKQYKDNPGKGRIPFLLDLSQNHRSLSLESLLHEQLEMALVKPTDEKIFLTLLAKGKILLIIDAFDEMAAMSSAKITLNNFRQLNKAVIGETKVILTTRTHYFRDKFEVDKILKKQGVEGLSPHATMLLREVYDKPEYEIVYLKEFTPDQVKTYLEKALKDKWQEADNKIKSIYNLEDLSSRPVLLDMIVKTLPRIDEKRLEEFSVVHLYELFTYNWFEREAYRLEITQERLNDLMEELAYQLWQEGKNNIHHTDLPNLISYFLKSNVGSNYNRQTLDYKAMTASLLVRDDEGNYRFAHTSFQEFLVARKIKKELETKNYNALHLKRLSFEIIFFLRLFWDNDDKLILLTRELLEHEYKKNISENALVLFYEVLKMRYLNQRFPLNEKIEFTGKYAKEFHQYLEHQLPSKINMQTADLSGTALSYTAVVRTDFTAASLENGVLVNSRFENVTFNRTILNGSDFTGSFFRKVKFQHSETRHCCFKDCLFEDCGFIQSSFRFSNFMNVTLDNCINEGNDFTGAGFLGSSMKIQDDEKNIFFGPGKPGTPFSALKPLVNLGHGFAVKTVAVSSDNRFIVSGSLDNTFKLWNLESGCLINTFAGHTGSVNSVCISPDNKYIISSGDDQTLKLWDLKSGCLIKTLKNHKGPVRSVFISPDSRRLVSGSSDHTLKLWDLENTRLIKTLTGHVQAVNSVCISPNNQWAASGSADHTLKLWELETGRLIETFTGHDKGVNSVFIGPDNRRMVSGSSDGTIKLWDLEKSRLIHTLQGHDDSVNSVFISPDSQQVVSGSDDHTVKLWNLQKGCLTKSFEEHGNQVNSVFISPDNRRIVSGGSDYTVKLWDIESSQLIKTLEGHNEHVESVFITPDNQQIVSGSDDHTFKFWNLENSVLIKTLKGHPGHIHFKPVFISKDEHWMVSGGLDNTLKLWDMKTNQWVYTIILLPGNNAITLFPNNNRFFASPGTALQWLYYTDGLAQYPAKDLPQLRLKKPREQGNGSSCLIHRT